MDPELLASGNGRTVAAVREALKQAQHTLRSRFLDGAPAHELIRERAALTDQALACLWQHAGLADCSDLALVAVGGYGRGELHPCSDVDLLILLGQDPHPAAERIAAFLTTLWDIGLEIGQSVRTPADCAREAADLTVVTNLIEARLLLGNAQLFAQMLEAVDPAHIWPVKDFFEAKTAEQLRRHHKYHDTAYNLEPNIKEGPGGLRDIQTISWVARRHFGDATLADLVTHGFLTPQEYDVLLAALHYLARLRFALHTLTNRREDRLLFDHQRTLAAQFGFVDQEHALAVEQFMQTYYRTVMEVARLNDVLLQLFDEAILGGDDLGAPVPINRRFQSRGGYLEVTRPNVFLRYPTALLEVFLLLQQHPELKGVRAETIRLIRQHRPLIDDRFRNDVRAISLFMEILRQPRGLTASLRRMNHYGILEAYLPEYARIAGRMQYDLFHAYTVDQHTLFVVRNLRRLYVPQFSHEFPQCSALMQSLCKPELLYIAAMYHDIAKGRGGDHSVLGALDAEAFCRRHGLSRFDTGLVMWLVRNHLIMSMTAQKKDITDPDVIHEFARRVGDRMHLDYLYLLTVADIRATNPTLWNTWRESLLRNLYENTRRALRRGLERPIDREQYLQDTQQEVRTLLGKTVRDEVRVHDLWQNLSDDYFWRFSVQEIAWHTRALLKKADDGLPLVLIRTGLRRGGTEVFLYMPDRDNLFALMASIFDQLGLNIVDARIITLQNGYALDSYTVLDDSGDAPTERTRLKHMANVLRRVLGQADARPAPPSRRQPRVLKHFHTPTRIVFNKDPNQTRTVLELVTGDRPGLLSRVGQAFMECGIRVHNARIATIGERAEDIFFVTAADNRLIADKSDQDLLRAALLRHLDGAA